MPASDGIRTSAASQTAGRASAAAAARLKAAHAAPQQASQHQNLLLLLPAAAQASCVGKTTPAQQDMAINAAEQHGGGAHAAGASEQKGLAVVVGPLQKGLAALPAVANTHPPNGGLLPAAATPQASASDVPVPHSPRSQQQPFTGSSMPHQPPKPLTAAAGLSPAAAPFPSQSRLSRISAPHELDGLFGASAPASPQDPLSVASHHAGGSSGRPGPTGTMGGFSTGVSPLRAAAHSVAGGPRLAQAVTDAAARAAAAAAAASGTTTAAGSGLDAAWASINAWEASAAATTAGAAGAVPPSRCDSPASASFSGLGPGGPGALLRVHCATFNMSSRAADLPLPAAIVGLDPRQARHQREHAALAGAGDGGGAPGHQGVQEDEGTPHLVAMATQEASSIAEWETAVGAALGPRYCRLGSVSLRSIALGLWGRRSLRRHVGRLRASSVATGLGNVVGNKGGVALSLELGTLRLLFVGCHFAAHDDQVARRNADFHLIRSGLFAGGALLPPAPLSPSPMAPKAAWAISGAGGHLLVPPQQLLPGEGGGGMFRVGSGLIVPQHEAPPSPLPPAGLPARAAALGQSCRAVVGEREASISGGGPDTSSAGMPVQQGLWQRLVSGGGSASGGGWSLRRGRGRVAPEPSGEDSLAEPRRVASCPTLPRESAATPAGAWAGGGPLKDGPTSAAGGAAGGLPRTATSVALAALAGRSGREASESGRGWVSPGVSRRPSFLSLLPGAAPTSPPGPDATEQHDAVFWLGDLNYRVNGGARVVTNLLRARLFTEVLLANDQLGLERRRGTVFKGYLEGHISFPPTFKFRPGPGGRYSSQRTPSWTDRILWKVPREGDAKGQRADSGVHGGGEAGGRHQPSGSGGASSGASSGEHTTSAGGSSSSSGSSSGSSEGKGGPTAPLVTVRQAYYDSLAGVASSDHKPVVAGFGVAVGRAALALLLPRTTSDGEDGNEGAGDGTRHWWRPAGGCPGSCCMM